MHLSAAILLSAVASGLAVVLLTWIADKVGGTLGGLLATAPVTTAAAMLYLSGELGNDVVGASALQGGKSLFAAVLALPLYFYAQKRMTDPVPVAVRIITGLILYIVAFTGGTLLADAVTPPGYEMVWIVATLVLVGLYAVTFSRVHIPSEYLRGERGDLTFTEAALRFLAGAGVILLVTWLRDTDPLLTTAWAVFPGTLIVTLGVLGFRNGAGFSARAAQGGVLGGPPLVAYLLVIWGLLGLHGSAAWSWFVQVPAWGAYFAALYPLWRWQQRRRATRPPRAPAASQA